MPNFISVILPTYNPDAGRLNATLQGLKAQTHDQKHWELIIVNNNSSIGFEQGFNLEWHPMAKIINEPQAGLTYARLKGFGASKGNLIVMVDDDNILDPAYLENVNHIFEKYERMGCAGGSSKPLFESPPPNWLIDFYESLALRDFGEQIFIEEWANQYPAHAPIGAGMAIRKDALATYIHKNQSGPMILSDRQGSKLSSGGDNDMVLEILKSGWQSGYFPQLTLQHIIPKERMQVNYLARLTYSSNISWVKVLDHHGINPWKKIDAMTLLPRNIKAWFKHKAWRGSVNYIKWKAACGLFKGLSTLKD